MLRIFFFLDMCAYDVLLLSIYDESTWETH
jgi:hypothetical protein